MFRDYVVSHDELWQVEATKHNIFLMNDVFIAV